MLTRFPSQPLHRPQLNVGNRASAGTPVSKSGPAFSGNGQSTLNSSHGSRHSHHPKLRTNDGQDFDKYWERQGLRDFQIDWMKSQALKQKPARYIRGNESPPPNFETTLHRTARGIPVERPGTPNEQQMLASQRHALADELQSDVQVFLARLYLYCTHRLKTGSKSALRAEISKYAVPLSPDKELYRGMLLSGKQLTQILESSEGELSAYLRRRLNMNEAPLAYPQLAKHLLHGFPLGNGKYSHHGITSVSTRPGIAMEYAHKSFKEVKGKDWDPNRNKSMWDVLQTQSFLPVMITIVNDPLEPAKGFVMDKNYYKPKHEVILDSTNDYVLDENPLRFRYGILQLRILASHSQVINN